MNGRVAASAPTTAQRKAAGVIPASDEYLPAGRRSLHLLMATETQVGIGHGEHFGVDRSVGIMTNGASFPHRRVLVNDRLGLLAMALGARFI